MPKLNQVLAILQGNKKQATAAVSELYKKIQKSALFSGSSRTYVPDNEENYVYPGESQKVTLIAQDCLEEYANVMADFFNLAYTQDVANTKAVADIVVGDSVILKEVPVTHLLFLEKQLLEFKTFISKLPTLPIDKDWRYDSLKRFYVTPERQTVKTKKITEYVVVVEPTDKHRAEVRDRTVDINEGVWSSVEYNGALPENEIKKLLKRVDTLIEAVIFARESANSLEVKISKIASDAIFGYLLG